MNRLQNLRAQIRANHLRDESELIEELIDFADLDQARRAAIKARAITLIDGIRDDKAPGLMDVFLAEYGLSTDEGVALMCLAEALLRVPDADTIDALIEDKIAPSEWGAHLGKSSSSLVNASTWALMLTGKVLNDDAPGLSGMLRGMVKRLGEPVIRTAVGRAMKEMGAQFVLGETIEEALKRGQRNIEKGYCYSYDMLGEAALTQDDADAFDRSYSDAIARLSGHSTSDDIRENPGISIKLSALHPRYEYGQKDRVLAELVPRTLKLAQAAKAAGMGLNIDAEEADRLDLSLDVIEAVLRDPSLAGWDGFGIVVQAYGRRAGTVLDWVYALASELDRKIMVRLVKGAYWDTEIKRAQVEGLADFPVFTQKPASDISFIANAKKLFDYADRIYPQFATHNAQTVAAVLELAKGIDPTRYEFQRLHGMGEALHELTQETQGTRCRIYAPVGEHRDLLAYLVRRLLENGANSSFVNQIVDTTVPSSTVAEDPFDAYDAELQSNAVLLPEALFRPERENARGWDLHCPVDVAEIEKARQPFATHRWTAAPLLATPTQGDAAHQIINPARPDDVVGDLHFATPAQVEKALERAQTWDRSAADRKAVLTQAADLFEAHFGEFFALLTREAGKTQMDAIAELREAVDFLRFYAERGTEMSQPARGIFTCISPWNFPLAIFTGQIAAALAAGNGVLAKPAETTSLIAYRAVELLHEAGVPRSALQLLPGTGAVVGAALTSDARVAGVCFTGSTETAQRINRAMAQHMDPRAPLIAETGGLNAMIVDSTALPEQAVKDIVASAFQSAGQRCSALRCLYVQEDVFDTFWAMLAGAMDEQSLGDPWALSTDIGPVIDVAAQTKITDYVAQARADGRVLKELACPDAGTFTAPTVIRVAGIEEMDREIFGPVLHIASFKSSELDAVVDQINATGYGLTFGMHSRIDDRVQQVTNRVKTGNIYINRNQIGAIVGSQPFGGEGMSGTGPKAGGPDYVERFTKPECEQAPASEGPRVSAADLNAFVAQLPKATRQVLSETQLPGPTGESNLLKTFGRGTVLCLGPTADQAARQAKIATDNGCRPVQVAVGAQGSAAMDGQLDLADLAVLKGIDLVAYWGPEDSLRTARAALAKRNGALIALASELDLHKRCILERHVCIDTTAAGGNTALLAGSA